MEKKIKAVIFDWAGTTVDYGCFAPVNVFAQVFEHAGIPVSMEEVRKPMGMLKWDHIRTMMEMPRIKKAWEIKYHRAPQDGDADRLYEEYEPALLHILDQYAEPKPYVVETVKKLRDMGIKVGSTTGYTDCMMKIVAEKAKERGYEPDFWISPDATGGMGRPYPYMIFKNMEALEIPSVHQVIKVGDTISDIMEGKQAGVFSIGILEGSSLMGLSREEYEDLSEKEKKEKLEWAERQYKEAGADAVIRDIRGVLDYIE